ncbi:MAG: VWA domain-containing protein [Verrucomicrobiota bacterium]
MNLAHPAWLFALALPLILAVLAIVIARLRRSQWQAFAADRLRPILIKRRSPVVRWISFSLLLLACISLVIALTRPHEKAGTREEKILSRNVLIALDLSRSMRVQDVKPDRLSRAKIAIYELLEELPNERVGIIGFAGSAYVYAPLTVDHAAVRQTVEQIDENWATIGGSNLKDAVVLAIDTLKKTGQKQNALVIFSDGEKHDGSLDEIAREAKLTGVNILAIGIGTENGDYVPNSDFPGNRMVDENGQPVISRLQPEVLRNLAEATNGKYTSAGSGDDIASLVKTSIKELDAFEMEGRQREVTIEYYQWFLLPAIALLFASIIIGTRWRGVGKAAAALAIFLMPDPSQADDAKDAARFLLEKNFTAAAQTYRKLAKESRSSNLRSRYHLGEGIAFLRDGSFKSARSAFSKSLDANNPDVLAEAHLGMANSLFQLGWFELSGYAYPQDPKSSPDMAQFDQLVRTRLKILAAAKEDGEVEKIEALITNWTDAVRHCDSAISKMPANNAAINNRQMTITYLKRLRELLEEEKEKTEQNMPMPQPGGEGESQPDEGDGDPDEKQDGDQQNKDSKSPGDKGDEKRKKKDGSNGKEPKPKDDPGKDKGEKPEDPNETPEKRARRILKDSADLEKGPLAPGQIEFNPPAKDW